MLNFPLAGCGGGIGSDRHGFVECHSTLGSSGARFDPGDRPADELVAEHDPQVSAVRRGWNWRTAQSRASAQAA